MQCDKKHWNNICTLWYSIHRENGKKLCNEMSSMVEAGRKAKKGLRCTELLKTMA